jgi:hypothetical protein
LSDNDTPSPDPPELHGIEPDRATAYRVGRKNNRNIYRVNTGSHEHRDDWHIGCMFTPEDGVTTVAALNLAHDLGMLNHEESQ